MAQKRGSSKSSGSRTGAKKASGKRSASQAADQRRSEIAGIVLIGAGVVVGVYLFISATGVLGQITAKALFGIFGIVSYILPIILIGAGILAIRGGRGKQARSSVWFVLLAVLALIALMQLTIDAPYENVDYMNYLKQAYAAGTEARHGGGFVGGALCYPLQLLGGNILAYTLTLAVILISIVAVTGLSLHDMSTKVGEGVQTAVQSAQTAYETRAETRQQKLFTLDLDADGAPAPGNSGRQKKPFDPPEPPGVKTTRSTGRKKRAPEPVDDDGLSPLPSGGTLRTKSGEKPVSRRPVPVVSDIWDDIEPGDDVPLTIKPVRGAAPAAPAPLPDTQALFGAQKTDAPAKKPGKKSEKTAPAAEDVPEIAFTNAPAYEPPSFNLLNPSAVSYGATGESPTEKARLLVETLASFHIEARISNITVGPVLTRFELQPAPGVRVSRITSLSNDIALALAAQRVRIEAPIPGKAAVGIEIPNKDTVTVVLRDIVESKEFTAAKSPITMALGKDISGKVVTADLAKMPHMLIAGATGSGKSVCINDIIISMVYKSSPADLKMILIDPKMVELSVFSVLPHLLIPVVTDPKKAAGALRWAVNEMTLRYKKFSEMGARDLARYNELMDEPEKRMPKLVVIIDELADLMMVAPDEVEDSICRIAQLGRASGIHLIVATQRPSADIITGLIKANIPSRCAFAVSSGIDSRIILDATGAEKLLGRGDMLFHPNGANKPTRLQCAFVSDEEVERITSHFKTLSKEPAFDEKLIADVTNAAKGGATGGVFGEGKQEDELLGEAVRIVLESGQASISMIQRRLRVGYARAARLIDIMEQHGYVSGFDGSKPRKVLIKRSEFEATFGDGTPLAEPAPAPDAPQAQNTEGV